VSSYVSQASNLTRRSEVIVLTSGCGHIRIWTRCSCGALHRGQLSCTHCFRCRITIPVAVSSLIHLEMNFWNGNEARLRALAILDHETVS